MAKINVVSCFSNLVSDYTFNRKVGSFHGITGISVINKNKDNCYNNFIRVYGNLGAGYINIGINNQCDICLNISAGKIMSILELLRYNKKTCTVDCDIFKEVSSEVYRLNYLKNF